MDCCEDEHPDISIKVEPIPCCCDGDTEQTPFLRHCLIDTNEQHNHHSCGEHHHCSDGHHSTNEQYHHSNEEQHYHPTEGECCFTATSHPCQGELSAVWVQGSPQPIEDQIDSINMNEQDASNPANLCGCRPETEIIYCNGYQATDVDETGHDMANTKENTHEIAYIDKNSQDVMCNGHGNCNEMTCNEHEMTNNCINAHEKINNDGNELDSTNTVNSCLHKTDTVDSGADLREVLLWNNEKDLSSHDLETGKCEINRMSSFVN